MYLDVKLMINGICQLCSQLIGIVSYSKINEHLNCKRFRVLALLFSSKIKIVENVKNTKLKFYITINIHFYRSSY